MTHKAVLSFRKHQNVLVATFQSAHLNDCHQTEMLRQQFAVAKDEYKFDCLLLNCQGLIYLISEAFGILIQLHKDLRAANCRLALCALEPEVMELLQINRLDRFLTIYPTQEAALQAESRASTAM